MKTRPKLALAAVLTLVAIVGLFAADQPKSKDIQLREMKKLDWFVGTWKGAGWIQMGPQGKHQFTQTEKIESKLDGLVLVIEGLGKKEDGSTVHSALAFVSYAPRANKFRWHAFTPAVR